MFNKPTSDLPSSIETYKMQAVVSDKNLLLKTVKNIMSGEPSNIEELNINTN